MSSFALGAGGNGWAVTEGGDALYSGTGGSSWNVSPTGTANQLEGVFAVGSDVWLVGQAGTILRTGLGLPDTTRPVTQVHGLPSGWVDHRVDLTFPSADTNDIVALVLTQLDAGAVGVTPGTSGAIAIDPDKTSHIDDGVHKLAYWAVDSRGNEEWPHKTCTVRIDTRRPVPKAYAAAVRWGARATLKYRVTEKGWFGPRATVKINVANRSGHVVRTIKCGKVTVNAAHTARFVCRLARGAYKVRVYATDAAGNVQAKPAVATLTVR